MLLAWRLWDEAVDTVFDGAIGHGEAIVLAQVFRPRSHQERLQVSAGNLGVGEEVPAQGAIAAPDFFEPPHGGLELARLAGSDEVFEGHQDRAVVETRLHGQPWRGPATPGAEIAGVFGNAVAEPEGDAGDQAGGGRPQGRPHARAIADPSPDDAPPGDASLEHP